MALQFKNKSSEPQSIYNAGIMGIPMPPQGLPVGIPQISKVNKITFHEPPPLQIPGADLPRALNYYADHGGCGTWRMVWPELLLNAYNKAIINGLTTMVGDERFYSAYKAIRLQRQTTPYQLDFIKFLKQIQYRHGFKLIYEIDDIIFKDDIPDYNRCKDAFTNEEILRSGIEIMSMCDEISVTCKYMKEYYREKTGNQKITVVPNYPPKFWFQGLYNKKRLLEGFEKNKKRPRIIYTGSGTHIDVINRTNQVDDFTHVVDYIIATRKDFKWVFMGAFPLKCKPFIDNGEMEFHNWAQMFDYPQGIYDLNGIISYAPLIDNRFNRAKSNIKYLEAGNLGIPCVCQDFETYEVAPQELKFTTGEEFIDRIKWLTKDISTYEKMSDKVYKYAQTMYLNDHLDEYVELYFTPYGSKDRKALLINNPKQSA